METRTPANRYRELTRYQALLQAFPCIIHLILSTNLEVGTSYKPHYMGEEPQINPSIHQTEKTFLVLVGKYWKQGWGQESPEPGSQHY